MSWINTLIHKVEVPNRNFKSRFYFWLFWLILVNITNIRLAYLPDYIHQVRSVDSQSWTRFQLFQSLISCKFKFILQSWCYSKYSA